MLSLLGVLILVNVALGAVLVLRPSWTRGRAGKILAFLAFFLLPMIALGGGLNFKLEQATSTEFCLSCHEMEPYGRSLYVDDEEFLVAQHFQKRLIDRDQACFTCHTDYTMFGDVAAKMRGLKHLYVHYFGTVPEALSLYSPYQNRECLHCHEGARGFLESWAHEDDLVALRAGTLSCIESGCHEVVHSIDELDTAPLWEPDDRSADGSIH